MTLPAFAGQVWDRSEQLLRQSARTCSQKMDSLESSLGSMPVSRGVPYSAFTIAPMHGWLVLPAREHTVRAWRCK